ncbi:MAG: exonuclease domain-containing protein, partial [Myxococcota bacterium]
MASELVFAFLDCEFGGLDPELHDLTEVGLILTDYRLVEFAEAQWRVRARPERITPESAAIFGYDEKLWSQAPPVRQVLTEISELLPHGKTVIPAGQNVRMDVLFLERAYRKTEIPYPFDYH